MRWILPLIAILSCGCSTQDSQKNDSNACAAGTKRCGTACVAIDSPDYGCAASACDPCPAIAHGQGICVEGACSLTCSAGFGDCDHQAGNGCETDLMTSRLDCGSCASQCKAAHGEAACESGKCVVKTCETGWKDCDGVAANGCESDPLVDSSNCGACGKACAQSEVCYKGQCVSNPEVLSWLETQKGGWCLDNYKKLVNLCGKISVCKFNLCGDLDTDPPDAGTCYSDYQHEHEKAVPFCCDTRFLKAYPNGIAIDVGFHYDGASAGVVLDLGGDVASGRVTVQMDSGGGLRGNVDGGGVVETKLAKGSYLVSLYVSTTRTALYVNGLLVDEAEGAASDIVLVTEYGPGMVLGARMSYWWEHPGNALRFAPFLFHLRDGVPAGDWSLKGATESSTSTLLLLANQGISGNTWTALVGEQTAYAVPQDDATPNPVWSEDAASQCF